MKTKKDVHNFVTPEIDLEYIVRCGPGHIYWKNLDSVYLGCNQNFAQLLGLNNTDEIIGMSEKQMPWSITNPSTVEHNIKADNYVTQTGQGIVTEEDLGIKNKNGLSTILRSEKLPLKDKQGNVVGVLGVSIDITDSKEAERLQLENEASKSILFEQEKFRKIVDQVSHDVRSPLASMAMIMDGYNKLMPELKRVALRNAVHRIEDIMGNLLSMYDVKKSISNAHSEASQTEELPQIIIASTALLQILTEKRYQYQKKSITFEHEFDLNSYFACIKVIQSKFKRAISNLMNNAVDALENTVGKINLILKSDAKFVTIIIQDTGKGIPQHLIDKIMSNIEVTAGKEGGHGIGLSQVRELLQLSNAILNIDSVAGKGTTISLTFPLVAPPEAIAIQIKLKENDLIIVLDDDESIHGAWDTRFEEMLKTYSQLKIKHFSSGQSAVDYINGLPSILKEQVFLLTDYELIDQQLNGLDVITATNIKRTILVTSHYANPKTISQAQKIGVKILPKQLAPQVPIKIINLANTINHNELKSVDFVILDDDKMFLDSLAQYVFKGFKVDKYQDPNVLLQNIFKYPQNTRFIFDLHYYEIENCGIDGLSVAKQLHELGYTELYLISGNKIQDKIPYVKKIILKSDLDSLSLLVNLVETDS